MDLKGTRTEANLMAAFAGESQARNKYTYYAEKAEENGYGQIAQVFRETAHNECAHAEIWFKLLHGNTIPNTEINLQDAASGEYFEYTEMYPSFAEEARAEGFTQIAYLFEAVAKIEQAHEERYRNLLADVQNGTVFTKEGDAVWRCANCGHVFVGKGAPQQCPVCAHPQSYFQVIPQMQA